MNEVVTPELKLRIAEQFEQSDKMIEEQDEYIERLRDEVKQLKKENRLIDENAAAVQKEYKAEIERLQSAYLRAVTERDNAIFQFTRREAERDKAVTDLQKLISGIRGYCKMCKHKENAPLGEHCRDCNKIIKQNYEFKGLE